jgi:glycosyltransferase involved in cell wall biosynthesis
LYFTNGCSLQLTIIIPTKNRAQILTELLESIRQLDHVGTIHPEIIVADNNSCDSTYDVAVSIAKNFPTTIRALKVVRPGKSAAINDAAKAATGEILAFLDDDVVVDKTWLTAVKSFFRAGEYLVGQGLIRLQSQAQDNPETLRLIERYRTIPRLEFGRDVKTLKTLNGANFFVSREVFDRVGGFDERIGPGASGTSEDVEFAHRLARCSVPIGYAPTAIVYHRIDPDRLTEAYFKQSHWRQGASRFLIRRRGYPAIFFDLLRVTAHYGYHTVMRNERKRYRSKGRIYHYLGMMNARRKQC